MWGVYYSEECERPEHCHGQYPTRREAEQEAERIIGDPNHPLGEDRAMWFVISPEGVVRSYEEDLYQSSLGNYGQSAWQSAEEYESNSELYDQ